MLQNNPELKSKIDQLWNKFWSGGIKLAWLAEQVEQLKGVTKHVCDAHIRWLGECE